jgi:hypothetical protein
MKQGKMPLGLDIKGPGDGVPIFYLTHSFILSSGHGPIGLVESGASPGARENALAIDETIFSRTREKTGFCGPGWDVVPTQKWVLRQGPRNGHGCAKFLLCVPPLLGGFYGWGNAPSSEKKETV